MAVLIVAGVSSSGKSTIGAAVAERLAAHFIDGDDLHPPGNVEKMHAGIALTDQDREPWLDAIRSRAEEAIQKKERLVIAASCLERAHRLHVVGRSIIAELRIAFLDVSYDVAFERAKHRHHHFFPEELVKSQFAVLEEPEANEPHVRRFDGSKPIPDLVEEITEWFVSTPTSEGGTLA